MSPLRLAVALPLILVSQTGLAQAGNSPADLECIDVAAPGTEVSLEGVLRDATFSDPYGEERVLILELPHPICIDDGGDFADPTELFSAGQVSSSNDEVLRKLQASIGRHVVVTGEGFAAHTRHHHAPLNVLADSVTPP